LIGARFQFLFFSCTYGEVPFRFYNANNPAQPHWTFAQQRLLERARLPIRRLYQVLIAGAALGLVISIVRLRPLPFLRSGYGSPLLIIACYSTPLLLSVAANRYHIPILGLAWLYLAHGFVVMAEWARAALALFRRPQGVWGPEPSGSLAVTS